MRTNSRAHIHESQEQSLLFEWASYNIGKYPELKWMFHIPNGGSRNLLEARNLKKQGVKSGVPDIFLPVPRGTYHGLYIEMKVGHNKPSPSQCEWIEALSELGYAVYVCYGFDEAQKVIVNYLRIRSEK